MYLPHVETGMRETVRGQPERHAHSAAASRHSRMKAVDEHCLHRHDARVLHTARDHHLRHSQTDQRCPQAGAVACTKAKVPRFSPRVESAGSD